MSDAPMPPPSSQPFPGLSPACPCPSCAAQTVQTSSGLSALRGTLLAYIQLLLSQRSKDLSINAAFQLIRPQHLHRVIPPQRQHLALPLVKLHKVLASLFIQHVRSL